MPDITAVAVKALSTFLPVFFIAICGYLYAKRRPFDTDDINTANINLFLPILIFNVLVTAPIDINQLGWIAVYGAAIVLGSGVLSYWLCRLCNWQVREVVPPMMFTNYGNLGLPLIPLAFGSDALPAAVVLFIVGNTLHMTVGFKIYNDKLSVVALFSSPMMIAAILGIVCNIIGITPTGTVAVTLDMIAAVAIPLMLFTLGMRLCDVNWAIFRASFLPALWCPLSGLLCFIALWAFIPLPAAEKWVVAVFAVLPPALLNYMFADRFNINPGRVASIVMTGNLLSVVIIPLTLLVVFLLQ